MSDDNMEQDKQKVELSFKRLFCALHGEFLRNTWPNGMVSVGMPIIQLVWESDEFVAECKRHANAMTYGIDSIHAVLDRIPACCRLTPQELKKIYLAGGTGIEARCDRCSNVRQGAPYRYGDGIGGLKEFKHLCFHCGLFHAKVRP